MLVINCKMEWICESLITYIYKQIDIDRCYHKLTYQCNYFDFKMIKLKNKLEDKYCYMQLKKMLHETNFFFMMLMSLLSLNLTIKY